MADKTPAETIHPVQDVEKPSTPKEFAQVREDMDSPYLVELSPEDDPKNLSTFRKWLVVSIISSSALCVTCASSVVSVFALSTPAVPADALGQKAAFTEAGVARDFHVSKEVSILGVSLFVQGLGNV